MIKRINLLWDKEELYQEWKEALGKRNKEYIQDLNLSLVFEEIRSVCSFLDFTIHENLFLYPCTGLSTILYRQTIVREIYENGELFETLRGFTFELRQVHKKLLIINKTKDAIKKQLYFLQLLLEFISQLRVYRERLIHILPEGSIFKNLTSLLTEYSVTDYPEEARQAITQYLTLLKESYSFDIILNKREEQIIYSAAIDEIPDCSGDDFSEKLSSLARFILESYDIHIPVYQDTDITALEKQLQNRVMLKTPKLTEDAGRLYAKYQDFPFNDFFDISEDLIFYLSYIEFMKAYEQAGFYFTLPEAVQAPCQISAEEAYDLSLGINQYKKDKQNQAVSNSYQFDEGNRIFILTGANQGGKTTFIRSIGIIQCLFQTGLYVPARSSRLCPVNQIFTHFSRTDEASAVAGRFEQELMKLQLILSDIKVNDMFLLNEPFTSTQRRVAVALLKIILLQFGEKKCFGGLVTHFFEIIRRLPEAYFFSLVSQVNQDASYSERTYKIMRISPDNKSYAGDIARKCGVTFDQLMNDISLRKVR